MTVGRLWAQERLWLHLESQKAGRSIDSCVTQFVLPAQREIFPDCVYNRRSKGPITQRSIITQMKKNTEIDFVQIKYINIVSSSKINDRHDILRKLSDSLFCFSDWWHWHKLFKSGLPHDNFYAFHMCILKLPFKNGAFLNRSLNGTSESQCFRIRFHAPWYNFLY